MPRKRHVSRNLSVSIRLPSAPVMPRKRHVSRNNDAHGFRCPYHVMPRKRHVSRNVGEKLTVEGMACHASQEACE